MLLHDMQALFDKHHDEHGHLERIEHKRSHRPDLHAFIVLDLLCPTAGCTPIVSSAEHDEIYLSVDVGDLAEVITESIIIDLIRCGIRYDDENESLCMFV